MVDWIGLGQTGFEYLRQIDTVNRMIPLTLIPLYWFQCFIFWKYDKVTRGNIICFQCKLMAGQSCLVLDEEVLPEGRCIGLRDGGDGPVGHDVVSFGVGTKKNCLYLFIWNIYGICFYWFLSRCFSKYINLSQCCWLGSKGWNIINMYR